MVARVVDRLQRLEKLFSPKASDTSQVAPATEFEVTERRSEATSGMLCDLTRHRYHHAEPERVPRDHCATSRLRPILQPRGVHRHGNR